MVERRGALRSANRRKQEILLAVLRSVREEKGLHQSEVALALGRPQSFVSKYESGARRLDLLELKDVCGAIGIDLSGFVKRFEAALEQAEKPKGASRRTTVR